MPKKETNALELSDRLRTIDGFSLLSDSEKRVCWEHITYPDLTKEQLASKLDLHVSTVVNVLHSETWAKINFILGEQSVRELLPLAIKSLRQCLLSNQPSVKLAAAMAVLRNADLIKDKPDTVRQDNKFVIVWGNDKPIPIEPVITGNVCKALSASNGH